MFTRYATEFANVNTSLAVKGAMVNLSVDAMLETPRGWMAVADLNPGDEVATLDGGFKPVSWISRTQPMLNGLLVPAGALGNCSDVILPADTLVGLEAPLTFEAESDHVSLPVAALEGLRGVRRPDAVGRYCSLGFDTEEMVWTQTGMLVHAHPIADAFFQTLGFADARGLISLIDAGHFEMQRAA